MSSLFDAMKEVDNKTVTTNGMEAYKSTLDDCLDLFATGASCRFNLDSLGNKVLKAYSVDKETCLRVLFYLRDVRGGQGERAIFRRGMKEILKFDYKTILGADILSLIPFFGRWDDLISLWGINSEVNDAIGYIIGNQLVADQDALESNQTSKISLLAKWMPSCNTSSKATRTLAHEIRTKVFPGMSEKIYRQNLSALRKTIDIVETHLSQKDYTFDYSKLPSKASMKYKQAFYRNDNARYTEYVSKLTKAIQTSENSDKVKVNVGILYPYEIIKPLIVKKCHRWQSINETELVMADNRWKSLPNYFEGDSAHHNWLVMSDVSGSMTCCNCIPMAASVSLAMYIAEHNTGIFKNQFITFHSNPTLVEINPDLTLEQKINLVLSDGYCGSTNITAAFDIILEAAKRHNIPAEEMPEVLLIVSDMQFNAAVSESWESTNENLFDASQSKFENAGYKLPKVVFWNVAQDNYGNVPVTKHKSGAIIINGNKPGTFDMMIKQESPMDFMKSVVNQERYQVIKL